MTSSPVRWALQIHGGAGAMVPGLLSPEVEAATLEALRFALGKGSAILECGGSSLDAVEAAVNALENDAIFNAGHGAVFTADGTNELDAAIMEGATRRAGAVAGVTRSRNPVSLARAVMESSPHVLLAGEGANQFAVEVGVEQVEPSYFRIEERWQQREAMKVAGNGSVKFDADIKFGTVGAVAIDQNGNLAAATSTGGLTGKRPGRIGDSAVIGAGTYADDRSCAVSATGSGEFYIRQSVGHEIGARMRFLGESAQVATDTVLAETKELGGDGGLIVISNCGELVWSFNTPGMYRGRVSSAQNAQVAIYSED